MLYVLAQPNLQILKTKQLPLHPHSLKDQCIVVYELHQSITLIKCVADHQLAEDYVTVPFPKIQNSHAKDFVWVHLRQHKQGFKEVSDSRILNAFGAIFSE